MKKIILTKGLPASGKTTWAKKQVESNPGMYKRINKDDLRSMLDAGKWSRDNEKFIVKMRDLVVEQALLQGKHVIIDDTNLHPKHEQRMREIAKNTGGVVVEIKDFTDVSLEECIKRDLKRPNSVGSKVIKGMYRQFLQKSVEAPKFDPSLPSAIVCDLDGTLALLNGRDPYDASTCENDLLNEPIADIIEFYKKKSFHIIFVSGRMDTYKSETMAWLVKHFIDRVENFGYILHMRREGDMRKDAVIKREIYDGHINGVFNVYFVLDDRNQVVEMWRSLGLTCLQVAEGDF